MGKHTELLTGFFGDQVEQLTEDQVKTISEKLDRVIETKVDTKVKFQTEVLEAEAKEKYDTLLTEASQKHSAQLKDTEGKTYKLAESYKAKMDEKLTKVVAQLKEENKREIESYKKDLEGKLDKYLELEINKNVPDTYIEAVAQVSVLSPIVEGFKKTFEEHNISVDDKNFGLLKDAKEEILKLREESSQAVTESMELNSELKSLKRSLKISAVCEGLTDSQREKASKLLESYDENEIGERYEAIREFIIEEKQEIKDELKIGKESNCASDNGVKKVEEEEKPDDLDTPDDDDVEDADVLKKTGILGSDNANKKTGVVKESVEKQQIKEWAELYRSKVK